MDCPIDGAVLVVSERSGVEIDHCPLCRGVWLDRGELDRIIERVEGPSTPIDRRDRQAYDGDDDRRAGDDDRRGDGRKKKRKGLLGELFELD